MADKSIQLILSALSQAVAYAEGLPLHGSKVAPGLFPANAAGKQVAQRCLEEGYLRCLNPVPETASPGVTATGEPPVPGGVVLPAEAGAKKTKTPPACYAVTDKGLSYLFNQVSPRQVLEDLVRVLENRQGEVVQLLDCARRMQAGFDALKANAERVLQNLRQPPANGATGNLGNQFRAFLQEATAAPVPPAAAATGAIVQAVVEQLGHWQKACGASEDCPLPDLFRQVESRLPRLSAGVFHDVLRQLHDSGQIYLHPWTGPLYDLPEPPLALLVGHEVAYYASLRPETSGPGTELATAGEGWAVSGVRS